MLMINGECTMDCPQNFERSEDGKYCLISNTCDDYERHQDDGECGPNVCKPRQVLTKNGLCMSCPEFFSPSEDGRECVQKVCMGESVLMADGNCEGIKPQEVRS
jgi:hypothetical protein